MPTGTHQRIAQALAAHQVGVLSTTAAGRTWSMPVQYQAQGLILECLVPRWSDLSFALEGAPPVTLVIMTTPAPELDWLLIQGTLETSAPLDWPNLPPTLPRTVRPADLFLLVRIQPTRIDLFAGSAGWGSRETLDL